MFPHNHHQIFQSMVFINSFTELPPCSWLSMSYFVISLHCSLPIYGKVKVMFRFRIVDTRIINRFTQFLFSFIIVENFLYRYLGNWSKPRFHSFTWWRHRGARYTYWTSLAFLAVKNWYGFHDLLNFMTALLLDILYNMWCFARFGTICTI